MSIREGVEKEMAAHPGILAWRFPWIEPGRLQPIGLQQDSDMTEASYNSEEGCGWPQTAKAGNLKKLAWK